MDALFSISPVDGRYAVQTAELRSYFSELGLFQYRVKVEVEYFIALSSIGLAQLPPLNEAEKAVLRSVYEEFKEEDGVQIKEIEKITNHDIKAVEYFLKEKLVYHGMSERAEFVHFALTSQDINNTAIPLLMKDAQEQIWMPELEELCEELLNNLNEWKGVAMLARTHGQPASPTTMGKELSVFSERLSIQMDVIRATRWAAKFGGATGNFNAHHAAYPLVDWPLFADKFVSELGLIRSKTTTQIEHYDSLAAWCHAMMRIHTILIDLCRDLWTYISMEYFRQRTKANETGSSAMPHKVNPIDFENAEGNFGLANALLAHFADKLPVSRLQRDLSDSTVLRNIGLPVAYSLIALKSVRKGISKLLINEKAIAADLNKHSVVIAEGIQTILRREGFEKPYEALKDLTRGKEHVSMEDIRQFIDNLPVSNEIKLELHLLRPDNYIGIIQGL